MMVAKNIQYVKTIKNKIVKKFELQHNKNIEFCIDDVTYQEKLDSVSTPVELTCTIENNSLDIESFLVSLALRLNGKCVWRDTYNDPIMSPGSKVQKTLQFNLLKLGIETPGIHTVDLEGVLYLYRNLKQINGRTVSLPLRFDVKKGLGLKFDGQVEVKPGTNIDDADTPLQIKYKIKNGFEMPVHIVKSALKIGCRVIEDVPIEVDLNPGDILEEQFTIIPSEVGIVHIKNYECDVEIEFTQIK